MKVLYATPKGKPDYCETLITEVEAQIPDAKQWAIDNGFDRLRVADIDLSTPPQFGANVLNTTP